MKSRILLVLCAILFAGYIPRLDAQQSTQPAVEPTDARAADRAAIRKVIDSFAKTFEARDAKALAAHFTTEGEFQNVQGAKLQGRAAMEQAFEEFFATTPEVTAEVKPESLRFLSRNSAIEEGLVTVQRGPTELATHAHYTALVISDDGTWRLAQLSESPASSEPSIADLSWLIGQWKSAEGGAVEIETTYTWDPGKKFIVMRFKRKDADLDVTGTQIIGLDPATGMIHSWTFEASGSIGEANWIRDGQPRQVNLIRLSQPAQQPNAGSALPK